MQRRVALNIMRGFKRHCPSKLSPISAISINSRSLSHLWMPTTSAVYLETSSTGNGRQPRLFNPNISSVREFSSRSNSNPYELLGVTRSASAKEIKLAYFKEAKQCHPDLHPNDPKAKEKFQRISAAYELLSDEKRRRMYDATGGASEAASGGYANASAQSAEDIFDAVKEDMDIIKEAFALYAEEVKDELHEAVECAKTQNWTGLYDIAKDHKFLILGVVVPTVVFLRYPPAVFAALRVGWAMANVALLGLINSGNLTYAARLLWQRIVKLSRDQQQRVRNRKRR